MAKLDTEYFHGRKKLILLDYKDTSLTNKGLKSSFSLQALNRYYIVKQGPYMEGYLICWTSYMSLCLLLLFR